jgi:tetratricopeptide (TPR) repeat protein
MPKGWPALDSLGFAHQQLGHRADATACYQQALGLHRQTGSRWGEAETLGHLGDTRHAAGNPEEARAAWEEALAILADLRHPDADQIRAKLSELDAGGSRSGIGRGRAPDDNRDGGRERGDGQGCHDG